MATLTAAPPLPVAQQLAELYVFGELLKGGVNLYRPLVNAGADALARLADGQTLDLQILVSTAAAGSPTHRRFALPDYRPRPDRFILCVTMADGQPENAWVFPSLVFYAYSTAARSKAKTRCLDLDSGAKKYDVPLWDYLRGFRDRWELITNYAQYRRLMTSPEGFVDLEDIVTAKEAFEQPDEERMTYEEYIRSNP